MPTLSSFNGQSLVPNIGQQIATGLQTRNVLEQQRLANQQLGVQNQAAIEEAKRRDRLQNLLGQMQGTPDQQVAASQTLGIQFPDEAKKIAEAQKAQFETLQAPEKSRIESVVKAAAELKGLPVDAQIRKLQERRVMLQRQGLPTNDTDEHLSLLQSGKVEEANASVDQAIDLGQRLDILKPVTTEKGTALQQNLIAAGFKPGTPEFEQELFRLINKPTGTTVTIGGKAEGKEREEIAKVRARQFEKILTSGDEAEGMIDSLNQLDAIDVNTGALEPAKAALASVVEGLGIDASGIANVDTAQSFNAASNRLVNNVLNMAKGPQTEGDAKRAKSTIANLGDSPLAAQFKTDSLRAVALRTIDQRDFIEERVGEGQTFSEARTEWNKFKKETPSLSDAIKNPKTGLPLFYFQFKELAKQRRPGISDDEIIDAWRSANAK